MDGLQVTNAAARLSHDGTLKDNVSVRSTPLPDPEAQPPSPTHHARPGRSNVTVSTSRSEQQRLRQQHQQNASRQAGVGNAPDAVEAVELQALSSDGSAQAIDVEQAARTRRPRPKYLSLPRTARNAFMEGWSNRTSELDRARGVVQISDTEIKISYKTFQEYCLEHYRNKLAETALSFRYDKTVSSASLIRRYQSEIQEYVAALKVMDSINATYKEHRGRTKFEPSTRWSKERELLRDTRLRWRTSHAHKLSGPALAQFDQDMRPLQDEAGTSLPLPLDRHFYDARLERYPLLRFIWSLELGPYYIRVFWAVIGGAFLVIPMLIMVLIPTLKTSLITTCVGVIFFGLIISCFPGLVSTKDVMSVTAAYAAVLVVFVGTSVQMQDM
ncbi:hypothetical protein M406DRAFT_75044 [Cryphonectria parasitica EP155]|uniref:Uncharacterized protein n=1 Tax=Cryphonectria parasitica (strain ATCC 38755 / EP155) TaxID=660469 RepID=A0A9P4XZM4_CRYP1|nr:uncharacterized protein M406DRAFT_75044 [Cryphonectria parasitica EP155]KAF3763808.1 hypothetical protein M406DRAFT_75044 [Cryphonectria parasitica EP155]